MVNQLKSEAMKSIIYIGLLLLTLTSCQEDKGNYTYRNINEISVTGIAATKTVTQFSILGMSPVINQTMPVSADDLEYLWYVDRGNGKIDTLSQELNIQTPVNLYPDTYEAYFVVIQKSTGIFTKVPFKLVVESQLGQGLLVLSDLNGYANLAYWERSGEVVQDVYEKVNPGLHLGRNPYRVCYMFKGYSIPAFVTVMCHDEQGGCALNPVDFTKFKDYAELFYQTPDPLHPDGYGYSNYFNYDETAFGDLYNDFIINNGQLHERSTYVGWYQPAYAVDQDYRLSEYTFMGMMQYIFYDNEHSQFLQKTSWPPNSFSVVEVPEGYFRDLYLVYADRGFAGTDYPHYYCVFKEKTTSDHYFVEVLMSPSGFKPLKKEKIGFAVQEDMPFAVSSTDLRSHGYSVLGFPADELNDPGFGLDYHPEKKPTGNSELSRMAGFFGNLNYTYDNRYFADFSVRADASSRFGADKRWAVFWSAGVGYNLHNEVFLKKLEWVSLLRLRASYGVTGGQNFNPYQAMTTYRFITDKWYGYGSGAEMLALGNDDLKWQSTVQKNFGLDLGMWKDRLTLTFNYYHKLSENSLTDVTLPPSLGFPSYKENLGEVVNEGWEFTLRGFVVKKEDFNIMLSVNGAQNNNKLKKISNSLKAFNEEQDKQVENKVMARYVEGQSLNTIWVVRSLGIDPANGKELFLDKNGKRTYDWNADDYVAEATTDPRLYGNLGLGIFYRGFSLNTYVNYSLGEKAYNQTLVDRVENADKHYNCDRRVLYDRWHKPGDETFFKDVKDASVTRPTSRFVQKNNYLNMTSLNVAYEFNPRLLEPLRIKYLKLAFYMTDLFRISTMKAERGLDYPFARTFTTSLQIRF